MKRFKHHGEILYLQLQADVNEEAAEDADDSDEPRATDEFEHFQVHKHVFTSNVRDTMFFNQVIFSDTA